MSKEKLEGEAKNQQDCNERIKGLLADPADGREPNDPKSKYDDKIRKEIRCESVFLFILLFFAITFLFISVCGITNTWLKLEGEHAIISKYFQIYAFSGLLGGVLFGMKNFYRYVAKGLWHQDRRYWRIMSPFMASAIAIVIGSMGDIGLIDGNSAQWIGWKIVIGFLAGYFADRAVGKMIDVARILFGDTKDDY